MTSAIARWHSSARPPSDALELAYADRLEAEMQELAIQLHKVGGEQGRGRAREGHGDQLQRMQSREQAGGTNIPGQQGAAAWTGSGTVRAEALRLLCQRGDAQAGAQMDTE